MAKTLKFGALAAAALMICAGAAEAATMTQTETGPGAPFGFAAFDGGLGTLTKVTLDWDLSADFSGDDPDDLCSTYNDCEGTIHLELEVFGGALDGFFTDATRFIDNPEVDAGFDEPLYESGSISLTSGLGAFHSPSPVGDLLGSAYAVGDLNHGWTHLAIGPITGEVTLTYTYAPGAYAVAEPGALAIFGVGMLALGVARRRRGC